MATLLRTKLTPPLPRSSPVERPHLISRLNEGLRPGCRLVLVSAPAGYGKTTLVTQWLHQAHCTVAWLSLDEDDNDPGRLLAYLIAALQRVYPSIGHGLEGAVQSFQLPAIDEVLTALVNQAAEAANDGDVARPALLVLDDVHVLVTSRVHGMLDFLLAHLPASLKLVIVARADPPLPLARLRGRGQLVEVRQADLCFEHDEAALFLDRALGSTLSTRDVAALVARTEGWIAGLHMAAVSLRHLPAQGERTPATYIAEFSGSAAYIVDYLGDEVLDRQVPYVRRFLLHTSILDRLAASLCDAVMGAGADGPPEGRTGYEIITELAQSNLFIVPLDETKRWYRYHPLFQDLLRQRLRAQDPDLVATLHRRASAWYEKESMGPDGAPDKVAMMSAAIKHAVAAEDAQFLAELLVRHAEALLAAGEIGVVLKGIMALPTDVVHNHAGLCLFQALGYVVGGRLEAAGALAAADAALGSEDPVLTGTPVPTGTSVPTGTPVLRGMVSTMHATVAYLRGEGTSVIRYAQDALTRLPDGYRLWRGSAAMTLGDAHTLRGDLTAAAEAYAAAVRDSQIANNVFLCLIVQLKLADTLRGLGQLRRAVESCRQQQALAVQVGLGATARTGGILALWGDVLREWNQLDEALDYVQQAVLLAEAEGHIPVLVWALTFLIHVAFSRGDFAAMDAAITRLDQVAQFSEAPVWGAARLAAWRARMWIAHHGALRQDRGYLQAAADLLASRGLPVGGADRAAVPPDTAPDYLREEEHLALVRWLIAAGRSQSALDWLNWLLPGSLVGGRRGRVIEMRILKALAWASAGEEAPALESLGEALRLAEPSGYIRAFVDEGAPMARLLTRIAECAREAAEDERSLGTYAAHLLALFPVNSPTSGRPAAAHAGLVEPLSERELEVLRLMAAGSTNREIAQHLVIAHNTVKKHVSNIIAKLVVGTRREAVRRARAMGLIA